MSNTYRKKEVCPYCGKLFHRLGIRNHKEACRRLTKEEGGKFISKEPLIEAASKRRDLAKKELGYSNLNTVGDYIDELNRELEKNGLKKPTEKVDQFGFTEDFYRFMGEFGIGRPRDYYHRISPAIARRIDDMRGDTTQPFYTPIDDMYGSATGYDYWHDSGRIPVSHLQALCSKRVGVFFRVCNGSAKDIVDNRFEFVKFSDLDTPIDPSKNSNIEMLLGWMRRTRFNRKLVEEVDFSQRTGLGHIAVEKYLKEKQDASLWKKKAPNTKPERFVSFSAYYMTPTNVNQANRLDYDKNQWKFLGGLQGASTLHESRVHVLEMEREEMALRGLALAETCWVAGMCYLNIQYYILKSLAQLGTVTIGVNVDKEFPTPAEVAKYLAMLNTMKANNFYVLGRGATLKIENAASKLGSGINDFMEFLKEDISAACTFPKNQLFGRSDGGGLSGAGAIVTKEDYLGSNISPKQLYMADETMYILTELCHFTGLEDITLKFNIDLLKTKEQRLKEQMMEDQVAQSHVMLEQTELGHKLFKRQMALQISMAKLQQKMFKENPEAFMERSQMDEENLKEPETKEEKQDFMRRQDLFMKDKIHLNILQQEFKNNEKLLDWLTKDSQKLMRMYNQNDFAWRREIELEKRAKD